jgi:hypothetical protein
VHPARRNDRCCLFDYRPRRLESSFTSRGITRQPDQGLRP